MALVASSMLVACASLPPSLTAEQARSFQLNDLTVTASGATIWWGEAEREYAESIGVVVPSNVGARTDEDDDVSEQTSAARKAYNDAIESPEARAYMEKTLVDAISPELQAKLSARSGNYPIDVAVRISNFFVASSAQALLIGGNHQVTASVELRSAGTGELIASNESILYLEGSSGIAGLIVEAASRDVEVRLAEGLTQKIHSWVFQAET